MTQPINLTDTVRSLFSNASLLVRQEILLARAEAGEKLEQVQTGLIAIVAGLLIAFTALLVLVQALVVALSNYMAPSLASLLVGVVLAAIAFIVVSKGQSNLKAKNIVPHRTTRSLRESANSIKKAV